MWTDKDKFQNPRSWLTFMGALIIVFVSLTAFAILSGTPNSELDEAAKQLQTLNAVNTDVSDEDALAQRETLLAGIDDFNATLTSELQRLLESKDYTAFEKRYGKEVTAIIEKETTDKQIVDVKVQNQPVLYIDNTYPILIVLGDVHLFAYYEIENETIVPLYVNLESEGE